MMQFVAPFLINFGINKAMGMSNGKAFTGKTPNNPPNEELEHTEDYQDYKEQQGMELEEKE